MAKQRYLRQVGTKKAPFIWTARKAARPDMVEHDPEIAGIRIAALKQQIADAKAAPTIETELTEEVMTDAMEIASLEAELQDTRDIKAGIVPEHIEEKNEDELDAEERQSIIIKDAEIIKIKEMTKKQLGSYAEVGYGEKLDQRESLSDLCEQVMELRIPEIFEEK